MTIYALQIENLTKTYANGHEALKGANFTVMPGDFYALLGPNGAGKSTTIGILTSLIQKTAGSVHVFGHDIEKEKVAVKSCIGVVPQEYNFNIFEKVEDIILNQAGYYGVKRQDALPYCHELLHRLKLWPYRDYQGKRLSGGLKRRLMIARGLIHKPKILLLDEPTAGVDIELRHLIWSFLEEENKRGTTIILTTHYLEEAEQLCRRVAIIDKGRIIVEDNMRALLGQVQHETILLEVAAQPHVLPEVPGFECSWDDDTQVIRLIMKRGESLNPFFEACSKANIQLMGTRVLQNRLETLFLQLVGQK